jgi:hypothetical protein
MILCARQRQPCQKCITIDTQGTVALPPPTATVYPDYARTRRNAIDTFRTPARTAPL